MRNAGAAFNEPRNSLSRIGNAAQRCRPLTDDFCAWGIPDDSLILAGDSLHGSPAALPLFPPYLVFDLDSRPNDGRRG
jgi:hypothetical protein